MIFIGVSEFEFSLLNLSTTNPKAPRIDATDKNIIFKTGGYEWGD